MKVISVEQMKQLDYDTINTKGVPGTTLMKRAGVYSAKKIIEYINNFNSRHVERIVLLAGKGNNGGDAYVIAEYLANNTNLEIYIYSICSINDLKGDAAYHAGQLPQNVNLEVKTELNPNNFTKKDLIIDALLGTGFKGKLRYPYNNWINTVNSSKRPVISIDIPSGLNGDSGIVNEEAIKADLTLTMAHPKSGLIQNDGLSYCGNISVIDIGIPREYSNEVEAQEFFFTEKDAFKLISRLPHNSHKKSLGNILILGGSRLYTGAPFLAGKAALKSGAGLVNIAVPKGINSPKCFPLSLIIKYIEDNNSGFFNESGLQEINELIKDSDVINVGPGLSQSEEILPVLKDVLIHSHNPTIVDADALNLISKYPEILPSRDNLIFTPHPGEAKRLLKAFNLNNLLDADRRKQATELSKKLGGIVILKGHRTIIAYNDHFVINGSGNPALATAGTGDVLAGILSANIANEDSLFEAACLSVYIHGLTADISPYGMRSLIADNTIELIPEALKYISPFA